MAARKPNFFIVGAPKCGTTSLAAWLDSHPEACVSRPKEPHFFSPTLKETFKTLRDYESCFAHAQPHHKAIGEASTHTFYFADAIQKILDYQKQAKFIICLRNPVEMAVSLHNEFVFQGEQVIPGFLSAWSSRKEIFPRFLDRSYESKESYRYLCAIGTHFTVLKKIVPEDKLLVLLLDDLIANEAQELSKVTEFLEISPSSMSYLQKNVAKRVRSKRAKQLYGWLSMSKRKLGIRRSLGVGGWILRANTMQGVGAATLTPAIRTILAEHFAPEIRMLESLLDRDLCHWLAPAPSG